MPVLHSVPHRLVAASLALVLGAGCLVDMDTSGEVAASPEVLAAGLPPLAIDETRPEVTEAEIDAFERYASQQDTYRDMLIAGLDLGQSVEWHVMPWADSLVRMYEVSRRPEYLDRLRELCEVLDQNRGDRIGRFDDIRGRVVKQWLLKRAAGASEWYAPVYITGYFAGLLGSYARFVAEDPSLWATRGTDAVRYARTALEALSDIPLAERSPRAGGTQMTYLAPAGLAPWAPNFANRPLAFNLQQIAMHAMVDLIAVVDSGLDEQQGASLSGYRTGLLLDLVRLYAFWRGQAPHDAPVPWTSLTYTYWDRWSDENINENGSSLADMNEDVSHAGLGHRLLTALRRDRFAINRDLQEIGSSLRIELPQTMRRKLADGFLKVITRPSTQAGNYGPWEVTAGTKGGAAIAPGEKLYFCGDYGWLAQTDPAAFDRCEQISLWSDAAGWQPNSLWTTYSALLAAKSYARHDAWLSASSDKPWTPWAKLSAFSILQVADLNGDGADDLLARDGGGWLRVAWSGRGEFVPQWQSSEPLAGYLLGDYDGDGSADLLRWSAAVAGWEVSFGAVGRKNLDPVFHPIATTGVGIQDLRAGDYDGDGTDDLLRIKNGRILVSFGQLGTGQHGGWTDLGASPLTIAQVRVGDFDEDGVSDLFHTAGGTWYIAYGRHPVNQVPQPFETPAPVGSANYDITALRFGDFNGDGATDISTFGSLGWYMSRGGNPDRKMAAWAIVNDLELDAAAGVLVGDFTGDGHEDILARKPL